MCVWFMMFVCVFVSCTCVCLYVCVCGCGCVCVCVCVCQVNKGVSQRDFSDLVEQSKELSSRFKSRGLTFALTSMKK